MLAHLYISRFTKHFQEGFNLSQKKRVVPSHNPKPKPILHEPKLYQAGPKSQNQDNTPFLYFNTSVVSNDDEWLQEMNIKPSCFMTIVLISNLAYGQFRINDTVIHVAKVFI
jgi:hypothetical protein